MQPHPTPLPEVEPSRVWTRLGEAAQYRIIQAVTHMVLKTLLGSAPVRESDHRRKEKEVPYE